MVGVRQVVVGFVHLRCRPYLAHIGLRLWAVVVFVVGVHVVPCLLDGHGVHSLFGLLIGVLGLLSVIVGVIGIVVVVGVIGVVVVVAGVASAVPVVGVVMLSLVLFEEEVAVVAGPMMPYLK